MHRNAPIVNENEVAAKDLTHAEILGIGENILDEREVHFQQEKEKAVAEAQLALAERLKRKYEREIQKQLEDLRAAHRAEINNMITNSEDRVQEEIARREAKLQTQMAEQIRTLQYRLSREMQDGLEELRRKHELELVAEVQKTVAEKDAETSKLLEEAKRSYETDKISIRKDLEKVCADKVLETEQRAEAKRLVSLAEQEKKFHAQMETVLQALQKNHAGEIDNFRRLLLLREDYIKKLNDAVDFVRESRQQLIDVTLQVHEQMKFFIDKTQPFTDGNAQFLVPRLDLSQFTAEPDTAPPYPSEDGN